jgi:L-threonylcarbamoyladenylate synthase
MQCDSSEQKREHEYKVTEEEIRRAAVAIRRGELVAFPTETVYGLGANALNAEAVAKIYKAKGRPSDNPLIVHVDGAEMAERAAKMNWMARFLTESFWPGPLSLVLNATGEVPDITRGGLPTVALRMPDNEIALALIRASQVPIAAPSANRSGRPSPTDAAAVRYDVGESVAYILDGGPTEIGVESTVLDVTGATPVILRPGGLSRERIEERLGMKVLMPEDADAAERKRSPGTRYRHYAPKIPLILAHSGEEARIAESEGKKWAWLGMREPSGEPSLKVIFSDTGEYAKELFRALRALEKSGAELIIAEEPESAGIGLALRDRLVRAAGN